MKTSQGVTLEIGRLPRAVLDDFAIAHPVPQPPTRELEVFGGVIEHVEDPDAPEYKVALVEYYTTVASAQLRVFEPAIKAPVGWWNDTKFLALHRSGIISELTLTNFLYHVALNDDDLKEVVQTIFYKSTTTETAIYEAAQAFNVTWHKQPVEAWRIQKTPGGYSRLMEDREAARFAMHTWQSFAALTGTEQSAIVAHYRQMMRLEYLKNSERAK